MSTVSSAVRKMLDRAPCALIGGTAGDEAAAVVSARVRLARNIAGCPFPDRASDKERADLWRGLLPALSAVPQLAGAVASAIDDMDEVDREVLCERRLISTELGEGEEEEDSLGCGVVFTADERVSIMVNEEDHLRLQCIVPGMDLYEAWKRIDGIDGEIESRVEYAFSPALGYLTSCPTNVGTGMRASVMMHLPALCLMNEIDAVIKGLGKIGFAVRGLMGEGSEASGNVFQISNQGSLGVSEQEILAGIAEIAQEMVAHEKNARLRVMESREAAARDHVGRAYGILLHAHMLQSRELIDLMSALGLGRELGFVRGLDSRTINELIVLTQPGHLQKITGTKHTPEERDEMRAELVRARLKSVILKR